MQDPDKPTPRRQRVKTEGPNPPNGDLDIEIAVGEDDRPFCDPYYAHVLRGHCIRWNFDGPWTVIFKGRTPLQGGQFVVHSGEAPVRIAADAPPAHYPYSVIVVGVSERPSGKPAQTILFDLACPEMILG